MGSLKGCSRMASFWNGVGTSIKCINVVITSAGASSASSEGMRAQDHGRNFTPLVTKHLSGEIHSSCTLCFRRKLIRVGIGHLASTSRAVS